MLLEKYDANWIVHFNDIKCILNKTLNEIDCTVEHVGSTAVPNLDAKPIIDIDIVYTSENEFVKIKLGLKKIGYYHNGNQGIEDRDVFKRNGTVSHKVLNKISHHLYVCKKIAKL